jgi:hypothetical protein
MMGLTGLTGLTGLSHFIWHRHRHHPMFTSSCSQSIPRKQRCMWAPDPERRAVPQPSPDTPFRAVCRGYLVLHPLSGSA